MTNAYKIMFGKPEGSNSLERTRHRWEDKSRRNLMKILCETVDWIYQAQDRVLWWALVSTVIKCHVPTYNIR
jgi:hypothetical protein